MDPHLTVRHWSWQPSNSQTSYTCCAICVRFDLLTRKRMQFVNSGIQITDAAGVTEAGEELPRSPRGSVWKAIRTYIRDAVIQPTAINFSWDRPFRRSVTDCTLSRSVGQSIRCGQAASLRSCRSSKSETSIMPKTDATVSHVMYKQKMVCILVKRFQVKSRGRGTVVVNGLRFCCCSFSCR